MFHLTFPDLQFVRKSYTVTMSGSRTPLEGTAHELLATEGKYAL
jgi:hypothetical protein